MLQQVRPQLSRSASQRPGGGPVATYLLIKLASRCNLACTYCYWFRDGSVYASTPLLSQQVQDALLLRLRSHIERHQLESFNCILHGGEPLLFGTARTADLLGSLNELGRITNCRMEYSLTTNGVLIDASWAEIITAYDIRVAVSIDGPAAVHDRYRLTHLGNGSHTDAVRGFQILQQAGVKPSIIAVCDPTSDPLELLRFFVTDLDCMQFDVLPPDFTHDDSAPSIAEYYLSLFDEWYDHYFDQGVSVRFLRSLVRAVLGYETNSDSFGYGPLHTVTLTTDGFLEPNDVLRIAGSEQTNTSVNVLRSEIDDVREEPTWSAAYESALHLCETCEGCEFRNECGGGHLSHRYSSSRRFDNPSVYCSDLMRIFSHVRARVLGDVRPIGPRRDHC